jgi:hypothetical protein
MCFQRYSVDTDEEKLVFSCCKLHDIIMSEEGMYMNVRDVTGDSKVDEIMNEKGCQRVSFLGEIIRTIIITMINNLLDRALLPKELNHPNHL